MDRIRSLAMVMALLAALALVGGLGGCARGGELAPVTPQVVMEFIMTVAGPINDVFYYFIPIDTDGDFGLDGPIPVAAGPFWQNGWGTGSFTHFVQYHLGQYQVFQVRTETSLRSAGGGITAVSGLAGGAAAGTFTITVGSLSFGSVAVSGSGMIAAVANSSFQSAGTLTIATNAAGEVVADSVAFTAASEGGRPLTAAEQDVLDALNAGGVALAPNSLAGLGLTLTLAADQVGSQTLTVAPTTASATVVFVSTGTGQSITQQVTLRANAQVSVGSSPLPSVTVTTGNLIAGGVAVVDVTFSPIATLLGPPFDFVRPAGGNTLSFTVDLAMLGADIPDLSVNMITTNELIFDPNITDPNLHSYDGLGATGNRFVTFRTSQFQTITNGSGLFEQEGPGDTTLIGPTTPTERNALDIVNWSISIRRLR